METTKVGRVIDGGGRGEAREVTEECTPQMALRLPLPRERKAALFPSALSDAVVGGARAARAGVRVAELGTSEEPQWGPRAADIRLACGFFLWLLHLRLP